MWLSRYTIRYRTRLDASTLLLENGSELLYLQQIDRIRNSDDHRSCSISKWTPSGNNAELSCLPLTA